MSHQTIYYDGFQPLIFKKYWDIVGDEVWGTVRDAFSTGLIDSRLAKTLNILIPRVDPLTRLKELRPISLWNMVLKLISKVLVIGCVPSTQM